MARSNSGRISQLLKREYHLPLPKNRVGTVLGKRIRWPRYFRDAFAEVRKVVWPTRRESLKLTFAVIMFAIILTIFTAVLDYGFSQAVERIFL
jgi:preprotein translocase subunit SecE